MATKQRPAPISLPTQSKLAAQIHTPRHGPATPQPAREAKAPAQDVSRLPPDDIFSRFSVGEIRSIHNKLKAEADGKQEELRLMVGERYRDLLQASTSIISISTASQRVTSALAEVREACESDEKSYRVEALPRKGIKDDAQLPILQSLSAHLKLLLDAPEQLWRLLEHQKYLHAAWLFLISRVVYRSLVRDDNDHDDEEDVEIRWSKEDIFVTEQFPLAQRQWDTISQFRHQIAHKATQDLRVYTRTPKESCESLIAILLLDSIPLSETLSLFLAQRSKALRAMFAKLSAPLPSSPARSRPSSPFSPDRRQNREVAAALLTPRSLSPALQSATAETAREARKRRKDAETSVKDSLKQILDLLSGTVETVRTIYGAENSVIVPLVEQLLESVQSTTAAAASQPATGKRSRHASRLSIISSFHATPTPLIHSTQALTTTTILESLPSSQLLIQFLPISITTYSPYIDTTSASSQLTRAQATTAVASWFNGCMSSLDGKLRNLLESLSTIRQVWQVRSVVEDYRGRFSQPELELMYHLIDEACLDRARAIWELALRRIDRQADTLVSHAVREIKSGGALDADNGTIPLALPTASSSASASHSGQSIVSYKAALQARISLRLPLLVDTIQALAKSARRLRKDVDSMATSHASDKLLIEYNPAALKTCLSISQMLHDQLSPRAEEVKPDAIPIFIGHIALDFIGPSSFVQDMCRRKDVPPELLTSLDQLRTSAHERWKAHAVSQALDLCGTHFYPSKEHAAHIPNGASTVLTQTVLSLLDSIERLGLLRSLLHDYQIPQGLIALFMRRVLGRDGLTNGRPSAQAQWDLALLVRILRTFDNPSEVESVFEVYELARKRWSESMEETPLYVDPASAEVKTSLNGQLARWQLLLGPLLGDIVVPLDAGEVSRPTLLLPFGAPPSQQEFHTALEFVKPGPRFGMLLLSNSER